MWRITLNRANRKKLNVVGWLTFYLYIILLMYFLFFSERYGRENILQDYHYNLEFFKEIKRFITYRQQLGYETFIVNIIGNVLAFAPLGFFLPLLEKRYQKFLITVFLCCMFSLCVELTQLYLKVGIFDVDDILMNTLGGILGYLSYIALKMILGRVHKNSKKK